MKQLFVWLDRLLMKHKALKRWKRIVALLAAIMTFVTTYALILPAITVEMNKTEEVGGMYLERETDQEELLLENALDPAGEDIPGDNGDEEANAAEVETDAPEVGTLKAAGDDYTVVLTYDATSEIPEGAVLDVSEIPQDSEEYHTYLEETKKAMGLAEEETLPRYAARFFDIKIMAGDKEFIPKSGVSVEITYEEPLVERADAEVSAVHFADETAAAEVIEANTTEILDDGTATVEFTAESFSVYGVIYTVDFNLVVDGNTYKVTVTYDDNAEIPKGTKLVVKEIEQDTDKYIQGLGRTWTEINKEYLEQEKIKNSTPDMPVRDTGLHPFNIDQARVFEITFVYKGKELVPKAPVQVNIEYREGMDSDGISDPITGVAQLKGSTVELVEEFETEANDEGDIVRYAFAQDGTSDVVTFIGEETGDAEPKPYVSTIKRPKRVGSKNGAGGLAEPDASKELRDNDEDGTYTLSLSVTGRAAISEVMPKANILFIMDRSSSMRNNKIYNVYKGSPQTGVTYYGVDDFGQMVTLYTYGGRYYKDRYGNNYYNEYTKTVYTQINKTRMQAEQEAMNGLLGEMVAENKEHPGTYSISIISFADTRGDLTEEYDNTHTETGWTDSEEVLQAAIAAGDEYTASGTNWEEALLYAKDRLDAIPDERKNYDTYVIFLTDGEPTAVYGETGGAHHYNTGDIEIYDGILPDNSNSFWYNYREYHPGDYYYGPASYTGLDIGGFDYSYEPTRDDARDITDAGYEFITIMTFNHLASANGYLKRLTNYAHDYDGDGEGGDSIDTGDDVEDESLIEGKYYFNARVLEELEQAFRNIFTTVSQSVAHGQVKITDGLTAGAMTSTFVSGKPDGVRYIVTRDDGDDETEDEMLYTVTAVKDGDDTVVTFEIDEEEYTTTDPDPDRRVQLITNPSGAYNAGDYYMINVGGTEYKMALAKIDSSNANTTQAGLLTWDLSPIGTLWGDCTYTAEFIVWPNQAAYDYVAALNNKANGYTVEDSDDIVWDDSVEEGDAHLVEDSEHNHYWTDGVAGYPAIVKYKDGPNAGKYAVLTNTNQNLNYSIVTQQGDNDPVVEPQPQVPLQTPDPMPLTKTQAKIEKVWNVDNSIKELYTLLYGNIDEETGKIIPYEIQFDIEQGGHDYTSVSLPGSEWDAEDQDYDWTGDKYYDSEYMTSYNGKSFSTHWITDFAISTGLMLSRDEMIAIKLDPDAYISKRVFDEDGNDYYVLEGGHNYSIKEKENYELSYEFDFSEPSYHPMLVDGTLMDVEIAEVEGVRTIKKMELIPVDDSGISTLKAENTLRGYIHLKKFVVDKDGNRINDNTEFTYEVVLENEKELFEGTHIPWYAVNDCFYHTRVGEDRYYYQVENIAGSNWSLTSENGKVYTFTDASYDEDDAEPQTIYCLDPETGDTVEFTIYGNQMDTESNKKATTTLYIRQGETVSIGNIPEGTTYSIKEKTKTGYVLYNIENPDAEDPQYEDYEIVIERDEITGTLTGTVTGIIIPNHDNNTTYTNKRIEADLNLFKVTKDTLSSETKVYLEGAEFTITMLDEGGSGSYKTDSETGALVFEQKVETDENGTASLTRLQEGYYEIRETSSPLGYVRTSGPDYFKVKDGVITRLSKVAEDDEATDENETLVVNWPENADTTGMFQFSAAKSAVKDDPDTDEDESEPAQSANYVIGNEPGVALPSTGGPGTILFYLTGVILTCIAGASLVIQKRRRTA